MFLDARDVEAGTTIDCDLCVAGAGAAGITIARELAGGQLKVCVLESGGFEFDAETQQLCTGEVTGWAYPDLDIVRMRYFGGTTNHWTGSCRPLDPIDFEARPWVPYSGWPFDRTTLDPFYERAQTYCQLGPYRYDNLFWEELRNQSPLPLRPDRVVSRVGQSSPPTLFGEVYRDDLGRAANIRVFLHANVLTLEAPEAGRPVRAVRVGVLGGGLFRVAARYFVLALGGIENARMLLLSNEQQEVGLGNQNDLVGRFFMDHPVIEGALFRPSSPELLDLGFYEGRQYGSYGVNATLQIAEETLRREGLQNLRAPFIPVTEYQLSAGIESYHQILGALERGELPDDLWRHVGNVISDLDMVAEAVSRRLFDKRLFESAREMTGYVFDSMIEPTPDPENRITLTEARDAFGLRKVTLHWRIQDRDRENLWRCYEIIGAELGRIGAGRVRLLRERGDAVWTDRRLLSYGSHHIGTTRMHADPKHGVVDADCRVHGVPNLYIAGSSVFPTASHVPPTLTIVALAIRLAEHLQQQAMAT